MAQKLDIRPGQTFNNWTVIAQRGNYRGVALYLCRCKCGTIKSVRGTDLYHGRSRQCGSCGAKRENAVACTKLYSVWQSMKHRCENPRDKGYKNYGGRGINVCEEWHDYFRFREWCYANGYAEGLSIDRIDNDGNYCPENCRWTTSKIQANNTRNVRWITYNGETKTLSEWAQKLGLTPHGLLGRLEKHSVDEALSVPKTAGGRYTALAKRDSASE